MLCEYVENTVMRWASWLAKNTHYNTPGMDSWAYNFTLKKKQNNSHNSVENNRMGKKKNF